MKIVYITAQTPYGKGETFILEEMLEVKRQGVDVIVIPRSPIEEIFHKAAEKLKDRTIWLPLIDLKMIIYFLVFLILKPSIWKIIKSIVLESRNFKILLKNLIVLPKSVYISRIIRKIEIDHIHAHWGTTTATMVWIISELTGIPWSMTLHRWDITENNMLRLKVEKAAFTRCIAKDGQKEVLSIVGKKYHNKIKVLYMGICIPKKLPEINQKPQKIFVITCPANFVPKKGHKFLIEACSLLVKRGFRDFQCLLIGDGPIKDSLRNYAVSLEVEHIVKFLGLLPHENLLKMYENGEVNVVVLPSIITDDGEKEGIPVALMEAMAYGIPVISTNTGGIPELLEGAGIIIPEKDPVSLANAIEKCIIDREYAYKLGLLGREKVMRDFNIEKNVKKLIEEMKKY